MTNLVTVFEEKSGDSKIKFAVEVLKRVVENLQMAHLGTDRDEKPHVVLQKALKLLKENTKVSLNECFVLYCGDNLYLFDYNSPCNKIDGALLIQKLLEISGGYETEEQKDIFQSLLMKGYDETAKKHSNLSKLFVSDKFEEVIGREGKTQQLEMMRNLLSGGLPKVLGVEKINIKKVK